MKTTTHNRFKDGCPDEAKCEECERARRARAAGHHVWVICQSGSTVRTFTGGTA